MAASGLLAHHGDSDDDDDPLTSVRDLLALASEAAELQQQKGTSLPGDAKGGEALVDHCQVCDLPTETRRQPGDSSLSVCQACKKFFQRNRNRQESSLRCITGSNNCDIGKGTAETIATGVVWRKVCPRCRLAKCLAIGMQNTYRDIWPSIAQMPIRSPELHECSAAEDALRQTAVATTELANSFKTLPLKVNDKVWTNEQDCWKDTMQHFECITRNVSTFVKSIPGYNDLPVKDRCALFGNSLLPIAMAEANRAYPTPGCISAENAERIFQFFPEYRYVRKEADHLWSILSSWNPSLTEFSCLLAILFYRSFYITRGADLHGSNGNIGSIADLELAIRALLMQQCSGDVTAFNSRIQHLLHVAENLRSTVVRRQAASAEVAARCPHLFQMNALYTAIQREYYKNNAPQPKPPASVERTSSASELGGRQSVSAMSVSSAGGGDSSSSSMRPSYSMSSAKTPSTSEYYGPPRSETTDLPPYPTPPGGSSSHSTTHGSTTPATGSTPVSSPGMTRAQIRPQFPPTPGSTTSGSSGGPRSGGQPPRQ